MTIKRTAMANQPMGAAWVTYPWTGEQAAFADHVHAGEYPTHSPILGPDGRPLQYEPRQPLGFDLRGKPSK